MRRSRTIRVTLALIGALVAGMPAMVTGQTAALEELSLEELANVEVTSASRRQRKLSESANAVHVITREDIRRSGATSLPEVLRMAPGVHVAHIDGNKWAVGVRGFNDRWSNKLLVLVDGRSVYTPLFSGVFWEVEDTLLEDIDRIEVIRGPGATMWGANAVNGVINIITRSATRTTGAMVAGAAGSHERAGEFRYGAELGNAAAVRVFAKSSARDAFGDGIQGRGDSSDMLRVGGRVDLFPAPQDTLTFTSEAYRADFGSLTSAPVAPAWPAPTRQERVPASGAFVLGTWKRALSPSSSVALQSSFEHTYRGDLLTAEYRDTIDLDFQHQFNSGRRHEYVWGTNVRRSTDEVDGTYALTLDPPHRQLRMFSAFAQTDLLLQPERWRLTLGTRVEHHNVAGVEVLPNVRLLWTRHSQSAWTAVSRGTKNPSRIELGMRVVTRMLPPHALYPGSPMAEVVSTGTDGATSESVVAYEAGYRVRPVRQLSIDVATFYNSYDRLLSRRAEAPSLALDPIRLIVPFSLHNVLGGESYGAEVAADWRLSDRVRLAGWMSERRFVFEQSQYVLALMLASNNPRRIGTVRTQVSLPGRLELTPAVSYAGALGNGVGSVVSVDANATWHATGALDVSLVGRDLLDRYRAQFTPTIDGGIATEVPRSIVLKSVVRF
jgi:iron complex outermembrane receptor protein